MAGLSIHHPPLTRAAGSAKKSHLCGANLAMGAIDTIDARVRLQQRNLKE
jgi:hypothetical protein